MTAISNSPWPIKSREIQNHHSDSTLWNSFRFRDTDIVIASYPKSGTTWLQQIVAQLLFHGAEGIKLTNYSPWIEVRHARPKRVATLEKQTHRRFLKTHLPVDALVFSPMAKYIYIGRDGRDAAWSLHNHLANATDAYYDLFNSAPGRVGPPLERVSGKLVHFNELKADLAGSVRSIATFLDIPVSGRSFSKVVEHCTFAHMKAHAELSSPASGVLWKGGARTFINKGANGRWLDTLSAAEITAYEAKAVAELGPECAKWLAHGGGAQPLPINN